MVKLFLFVLAVGIYFHYRMRVQEKQIRVLTAFVAGLFTKSVRFTEMLNNIKPSDKELYKDSISYKEMLGRIGAYIQEDYWEKPYRQLLLSDWNLFFDNRMRNNGFDEIYKDLIVSQAKETLKDNNDWFSVKEKNLLRLIVKKSEEIDSKQRDALKSGVEE